ncbi:MAG: hypothetical protein IKA72_01160 [Clostridia bacterium]|nr:hypothetical protein [Clostridia bacterium]
MKRKIYTFFTLLLTLVISVFSLVACDKHGTAKAEIVSKSDTMVVIKVNETEGFATLLDAMTYLKGEGELTFEIVGGLVSSIEGKENPADWSASWLIFTSDKEMSNTEWGTTTYNGNTYGSAILGAEQLSVSAGEYYVWEYVTF